MKKALILSMCMLVFGFSGVAGAYPYQDLIDTWPIWGDAKRIVEGSTFIYTHDLTQEINFLAGDRAISGILELDFTNDFTDFVGRFLFVQLNFEEYVRVAYDGQAWVNLGEVDNGQYSVLLDIGFINDNGTVNVAIQVTNNGVGPGTAWLDHSRVYGEAAAVPEPTTMLLLGSGLLGLGVLRRKLKK